MSESPSEETAVAELRSKLDAAEQRAKAAEVQNSQLRTTLQHFEATVRVLSRMLHP